jgi:hypothetical protein
VGTPNDEEELLSVGCALGAAADEDPNMISMLSSTKKQGACRRAVKITTSQRLVLVAQREYGGNIPSSKVEAIRCSDSPTTCHKYIRRVS